MHEPSKLISVLIPAYNGEPEIAKALLSVTNQNYRPLQLIVVDDASKDGTATLVAKFIQEGESLKESKLLKHDENLGLSKSLNDGLLQAKGSLVLILHQDCELIGNDWIEKASARMKDEKVAIVTGYYGIPDMQDNSYVKRAFGVLRKQFHRRPDEALEDVTFAEGKCDMYQKSLLDAVGGFPSGYRIAGEDLIVSYRLRRMGYRILKCYDLPVIQKFTGAADSFLGNLRKELTFGKAMGGVFSEFKFYLFRGVRNSKYSGSRSLQRASQPIFVSALIILTIMAVAISSIYYYLLTAVILTRYFYYVRRVLSELRSYTHPVTYPFGESLATAFIGILTDFAYSLGFAYGLARHSLGLKL